MHRRRNLILAMQSCTFQIQKSYMEYKQRSDSERLSLSLFIYIYIPEKECVYNILFPYMLLNVEERSSMSESQRNMKMLFCALCRCKKGHIMHTTAGSCKRQRGSSPLKPQEGPSPVNTLISALGVHFGLLNFQSVQ